VDSGWRSPAYQDQLLREAVFREYGSEAEAGANGWPRPTPPPHVSGGRGRHRVRRPQRPGLSRHGAAYGLCQIYRNEPWHYELRPAAVVSWLPGPVRRPYPRSTDAAVTQPLGVGPGPIRSPHPRRTMRRSVQSLAALAMIAVISVGMFPAHRAGPSVATALATRPGHPPQPGADSSGSGNTDRTASPRDAAVKFAGCMRKERHQGVPGPGRVGRTDDRRDRQTARRWTPTARTWTKAIKRVQGPGAGRGSRATSAPPSSRRVPSSSPQCIRDHGREGLPGSGPGWGPWLTRTGSRPPG